MLTFAIPTWNRAKQLRVCIDSICEQIKDRQGFYLVVCDNGSTDSTGKVLKEYSRKYDFFSYKSLDVMREGASWVESVGMVKTELTWTFGDDDVLRPNALDKVLSIFNKHDDLYYLHATQTGRTNNSKNLYKAIDFLDLCETYGWIDTCGFISSNICRTNELVQAYSNYYFYNDTVRSIFPAAACLLESIYDKPAALYDDDLVGLQEEVQSEETLRRWNLINSNTRYFFTVDALHQLMKRVPALNKTFPPSFFRYHCYHLWDRHLSDLAKEYRHTRKKVPEQGWKKIACLAELVSDGEVRKRILVALETERQIIETLVRAESSLDQSEQICEAEVYGYKNVNILPPPIRNVSESYVLEDI